MAEARADLLFELGTEELPPLALKQLSAAFEREFRTGLDQAGLSYGEVTRYATPRRLALLVRDCQTQQPDRKIERRGPAVQAAFDSEGRPTKAAEGFARSCGTGVDQLDRLETDKGKWLVYQMQQPGKAAGELLPGIAENALNRLPIPKRMRWGKSEAQFVRPVHWLVFLLGNNVVPCNLLDATSGRDSRGHRFHHPSPISIDRPDCYEGILQETGKVITHFDRRREKIKAMVETTARTLGGHADLDGQLLDEVTALNEWPVPIAASFEEKFLEVPHEALVATMKSNQKYFPLFDNDGGLMNHFVTIANIDSPKPELIREGNERVVRPRLADAMFFWQQDGKKKLAEHIDSLKHVVFQKQLGNMHEKSLRVARLAGHIARLMHSDAARAERAGLLSRCDLMTNMVYEFPGMQGIMGRYQAQRDGEPAEIAQAMEEFYMPRFSGDELPRTATGVAISLAERLDTLVGIFGIGQKPTGDKDPFALRRAALGALRILREHSLTFDLGKLLKHTEKGLNGKLTESNSADAVQTFMLERLKGLYADEGVDAETFQAVAEVRPVSIADFDRRIAAVTAFQKLAEAGALAGANKRIRNILLKSEGAIPAAVDTTLFRQSEERQLHDEVLAMASKVTPLLEHGEYESALRALAGLRGSVDNFFDHVMVMDDDPGVRSNRLALLSELSGLFLGVADVSHLHAV